MRDRDRLPLDTLLKNMDFTPREFTVFANNNLVYLADLTEKTEMDLFLMRGGESPTRNGLGPISREHIREVLRKAGHRLKSGPYVIERPKTRTYAAR